MEMKMFIHRLFFIFLIVSQATYPQLLLEENFNYSSGSLTEKNPSWEEYPTGNLPIQIVENSLTYPGYVSSGIGNKIIIQGGSSTLAGLLYEIPGLYQTNSSIYYSYLIKVTNTDNLEENDAWGDSLTMLKDKDQDILRGRVVIKKGENPNTFVLGMAQSSYLTSKYYDVDLNPNETYLVVLCYKIISSEIDSAFLWINPILDGTIPPPLLKSSLGNDPPDLNSFKISQTLNLGTIEIDGIRISRSWFDSPLPVELSAFNYSVGDNMIKLQWRTETEINNCCFEIEKKYQDDTDWRTIGLVEGYGNSNSPKNYFFVDKNIFKGETYLYRLKQIDLDGKYKYSTVISAEIINSISVPNEFVLKQNYPNPFNPKTTIEYTINNASFVKLKIYDLLGNEIISLVNTYQTEGTYKVDFDASSYPSGIYFAVLNNQKFMKTLKMTLMK